MWQKLCSQSCHTGHKGKERVKEKDNSQKRNPVDGITRNYKGDVGVGGGGAELMRSNSQHKQHVRWQYGDPVYLPVSMPNARQPAWRPARTHLTPTDHSLATVLSSLLLNYF